VVVGAPHHGRWLGPLARLFKALLLSRFVSHNLVVFIAKPSKADLITIGELIATGKVTPVIGKLYSLSQVPEAMRQLETGHARGKIVINIGIGCGHRAVEGDQPRTSRALSKLLCPGAIAKHGDDPHLPW
jgi:Zinc-binding dehydrogenase